MQHALPWQVPWLIPAVLLVDPSGNAVRENCKKVVATLQALPAAALTRTLLLLGVWAAAGKDSHRAWGSQGGEGGAGRYTTGLPPETH